MEIDIQIRPIEVVGMRTLDVENLFDRSRAKPRKFVERQKKLLAVQQEPKPMFCDTRDFSRGNVGAKLRESPSRGLPYAHIFSTVYAVMLALGASIHAKTSRKGFT